MAEPFSHPPAPGIDEILRQYWGFNSFRSIQAEVIGSVLQGKDTLAVMPTGGGKSVCYQVPALARPGLCLVISPLIALMREQVEYLRKKGITALGIFAGMNRGDLINTLQLAGNSNCKFLYVSPERLETSLFREYLPSLNVNLIAVDEAHCISQWGYDFRPAYGRITALREELPGIPVLALTASATPEVQQDICRSLGFGSENIFRQSFARPKLSFSVFQTPDSLAKMLSVLQHVPGSSLVYCRSRRKTEQTVAALRTAGLSADYYHAGLGSDERQARQQAWRQNRTRIMVCTNAFGMGIDKPDVRTVIHCEPPESLEYYYQEAGRAGRDGQNAYAVLLCVPGEAEKLRNQSSLRFPAIEKIREVYQAIANYLHIPEGGGQGVYHNFPIADFLEKFQLPAGTVMSVLRILEQEGWLSFQEQSWLPSRARVTAGRQAMEELAGLDPELEEFLQLLLRTYEGIYDRRTGVFEKQLAYKTHSTPEKIRQHFEKLSSIGMIEYEPFKEGPQLCLLEPRKRASDLTIDPAAYAKRKQQWEKRTEDFISFILEQQACRSQWIGKYFGDHNLEPCGICDNCLKAKKHQVANE
jgi:ATP-dependent DNA helicase RecQ